jgi:TfoX/Sxy family transcriptional regulator of competence genes
MPADDALIQALQEALPRLALAPDEALSDRRMFGGYCFMINGKMLAGVAKEQLVIRLEEEEFTEASRSGLVSPFDFTGRPLSGFAYVAPAAFATEDELLGWLEMSLRYVRRHMLAKATPRPRKKTAKM